MVRTSHQKHCCDRCSSKKLCGYRPRCKEFELFSEVKYAHQLKLLINKECLSNTFLALSDNGIEIQGQMITLCHDRCNYEVRLLLCNVEQAEEILEPLKGCNIKKIKRTTGLVLRLADVATPRSEVLTRMTAALECGDVKLVDSYWTVRDCEVFLHTNDDERAALLFSESGFDEDYCLGPEGEQIPAECGVIGRPVNGVQDN